MTDGASALWYPAARWLGYLAVFLLIGAAWFRWVVLPRAAAQGGGDPAPLAARTTAVARLAAVLLTIALVARFYLQARSLLEPDEPLDRELLRLVAVSGWGKGWLAQAAAALVAMLGWRALARTPAGQGARIATILAAAALALASPLTGHAVGLPAAGQVSYPLMVLHVGAGALWLGTLGILTLVALRRAGSPVPIKTLIGTWSPLALAGASITVAAGVIVGWRYLGGLEAIFGTTYGRTLTLKVAVLGAVALLGAYNWRVVLPKLRADRPAPIDRTAVAEVAIGVVLLAITAVLVALPAPGESD